MATVIRFGLLFSFIMLVGAGTFAQPRVFTSAQFQRDFSIFRSSLEECHPGLYWYRTRSQIDSAFDAGFARAGQCKSEKEFLLTLDRTVSFIGCMHTGVNPSARFREEFWKNIRFMPIEVRMLGGKTYLFRNGSERDDLIPGIEITHINGLSMDSIRHLILIHDSADGYTTTWSIASKSVHLSWFLAAYVGKAPEYTVRFQYPEGPKDITLKALTPDEIKKNKERRHGPLVKEEPFIRLTFRRDLETAILHIDRFDNWKIGDKKIEFLDVIETTMKEIVDSGVKNLIIDVGDKGGGNEYFGLKIISHLTEKTFVAYQPIEFTNKKWKSMKYSTTGRLEYAYYRMKLKLKKQPNGTYSTDVIPSLKPMPPSPVQFTGDVYIITSGMTASATSDFAAQVYDLKRAKFVGEETGGSYNGNTSNFEFAIKLPETKSMLYVPLSRYINNVDQDVFFGRGVKPDYEVIPDINDMIKGIDTQLEFTLNLIRGTRINAEQDSLD